MSNRPLASAGKASSGLDVLNLRLRRIALEFQNVREDFPEARVGLRFGGDLVVKSAELVESRRLPGGLDRARGRIDFRDQRVRDPLVWNLLLHGRAQIGKIGERRTLRIAHRSVAAGSRARHDGQRGGNTEDDDAAPHDASACAKASKSKHRFSLPPAHSEFASRGSVSVRAAGVNAPG